MRYRIVVTTYANGRKTYKAEKKAFFGWNGISAKGEVSVHHDDELDERYKALFRIDKNFEGNTTVQKIEFEHIIK